MRRHPSLIPLSRQHRSMLMLAQLLKRNAPPYKGLPTDDAGKIRYAKSLWEKLIAPHFRIEEIELSHFVAQLGDEKLITMLQELNREHGALSQLLYALDPALPNVAAMDMLGFALEKHIRREERVFFQQLQQAAGEALNHLSLSISRA